MKIVFFGTSEFAKEPLKGLAATEHEVVAVVTQPDRPGGRGMRLVWPAVKRAAQSLGIPVTQPEHPNSEEFFHELEGLAPEVIVVVAYAHKLGPELLGLPPFGCINIHPSLLPLYRGAAPVNWAIIRGETQTGVTIIKMNERFDAGEILMQDLVEIGDNESAGELSARLSTLGRDMLIKTLADMEKGRSVPRRQDEERATRAPRIQKADREVDWSRSAVEVRNLLRGLHPKPGAFSYFREKVLKLAEAKVTALKTPGEPGEIVGIDDGIKVSTGDGVVSLLRLQPEGKREMSWIDFKNGFGPVVGERLGASKPGSRDS
jgi:methionyl-tRNA formyltransferase